VLNAWKRNLSRAFLRTSVVGYKVDGSGAGKELRTMRLKVIVVIGGVFERTMSSVHSLS
jgi:hypothetical protein